MDMNNTTTVKKECSPTESSTQSSHKQPYIKFPSDVFDALVDSDIDNSLKVHWLLATCYGLINVNHQKPFQVQFSGEQWGAVLGIQRTTTYEQQKALEKNCLANIKRGVVDGKRSRNSIEPTMPESWVQPLLEKPNRFDVKTNPTKPTSDNPIAQLAQQKQYFIMPWLFLKKVCADQSLSALGKIILIHLLKFKHAQRLSNNTETLFMDTKQLAVQFKTSCSTISRALSNIKNIGGILVERCTRFVKETGRKDEIYYKITIDDGMQHAPKAPVVSIPHAQTKEPLKHNPTMEFHKTDHGSAATRQYNNKNITLNILNKKTTDLDIHLTETSEKLLQNTPKVFLNPSELEQVDETISKCQQDEEIYKSQCAYSDYEAKKMVLNRLSDDALDLLAQRSSEIQAALKEKIKALPKQNRFSGTKKLLSEHTLVDQWLIAASNQKLLKIKAAYSENKHVLKGVSKLKHSTDEDPRYEDCLTARELLSSNEYPVVLQAVRDAIKNTSYELSSTLDEVAFHLKHFKPKAQTTNPFMTSLRIAISLIKAGRWQAPFEYYKQKERVYETRKSDWLNPQQQVAV